MHIRRVTVDTVGCCKTSTKEGGPELLSAWLTCDEIEGITGEKKEQQQKITVVSVLMELSAITIQLEGSGGGWNPPTGARVDADLLVSYKCTLVFHGTCF